MCPDGWYLPFDSEVVEIQDYLAANGRDAAEAEALRATTSPER